MWKSFKSVIEQASFEADFERGRRMRVVECLRQTITKRCVIMWLVIVWLESMLKELVQRRDVPEMELKQTVQILYWMWCVTGSQYRVWKTGWLWSVFIAVNCECCYQGCKIVVPSFGQLPPQGDSLAVLCTMQGEQSTTKLMLSVDTGRNGYCCTAEDPVKGFTGLGWGCLYNQCCIGEHLVKGFTGLGWGCLYNQCCTGEHPVKGFSGLGWGCMYSQCCTGECLMKGFTGLGRVCTYSQCCAGEHPVKGFTGLGRGCTYSQCWREVHKTRECGEDKL